MNKNSSSHLQQDQNQSSSLPTRPTYWEWSPQWSQLPLQPGVYWFLDEKNKILYVGKAKKLRSRLRSYGQVNQLVPRIKNMIEKTTKVATQILGSEIEALLVEAELIRIHQPKFNVLLKDDKSPLYVHINKNSFPTVNLIRKKQFQTTNLNGTILGPFSSSYKLKQLLKIIRPIFKWCSKPENGESKKNRPCFYFHIDQCSGACVGLVTAREYQQQIKDLQLFLKGKKQKLVTQLKQRMKTASQNQDYEIAAQIRDVLALITAVTSPKIKLAPDLSLPKLRKYRNEEQIVRLQRILSTYLKLPNNFPLTRIEGYDVSNLSGTNATVSMVVFTDGKIDKSQYRLFNIKSLNTPNDYQMLQEAIVRRQGHPEWNWPNLVVIDGGKGQLRAALSVWQLSIPIISIAKNPDRLILPISITHKAAQTNQKSKYLLNNKKSSSINLRQTFSFDNLNSSRIVIQPRQLKIKYQILTLPNNHPGLQLIQQIRDESHRFSKFQHTRMRERM